MSRVPALPHSAVKALVLAAAVILAVPSGTFAEEFSDGKLQSFATAWNNINQLAEEWKPQVEAATSEDQAAELLQQFEVEATEVIETTEGIAAAEYQDIMKAAQSDPALKERILAMLQNMQPK